MSNFLKKLFGKSNEEPTKAKRENNQVTAIQFDETVKEWPVEKLKAEAKKGNPHAQYLLGCYYESGYQVEENMELMICWLKAAADQGLSRAVSALGLKYVMGVGVKQDNAMAIKLFEQAAQMGEGNAMYNLGRCYLYGIGVEKDENLALSWFQRAAENNNELALETLGISYETGQLVGQDLDKAYQYYKKASELGYHNGYLRARRLYEEVNGVMLFTTNEQDAIDVASGKKQLPLPEELRNFISSFHNRMLAAINKTKNNEGSNSNDASPSDSTQTYTVNGVSFTMITVPGGTFTMGATSEQGSDPDSDEKPTHQVTLSSFSIGQTEVTQELWQAVMGSNPSEFKGPRRPVENVSWDDCQTFIRKLNNLTGQNFRLPTEAEWEYAARGGKSGGTKYAGSNSVGDVAWYDGNSGDSTHDVATKSPNSLGIYDMSGNVCEWCQDWYDEKYYKNSPQNNPQGPSMGSSRVFCGGSWLDSAGGCRVSNSSNVSPGYRGSSLGLRLAL